MRELDIVATIYFFIYADISVRLYRDAIYLPEPPTATIPPPREPPLTTVSMLHYAHYIACLRHFLRTLRDEYGNIRRPPMSKVHHVYRDECNIFIDTPDGLHTPRDDRHYAAPI